MPGPVVGMSGDYAVGCGHWKAEPPGGSQHRVTGWSRPKFGVEVRRPAESKNLLQKADVAREKHEAVTVPGKDVRQRRSTASWFDLRRSVSGRPVAVPVDVRDGPAERSPPVLIGCQCDSLLTLPYQMRSKDRPHTRGQAGSLKLDGAIYPIGVGAGQGVESTLGCCRGERLGTGDPNTKGEMGVDVEVSEHSYFLPLTSYLIQKLIQNCVELIRLIQLNPMAGSLHHPLGKSSAQAVQAEGLIVIRRHDRENWSTIAGQPGIGIEAKRFGEGSDYRLPRGGVEIGEQSLAYCLIGSGDRRPVLANCAEVVCRETIEERLRRFGGDLLAIADGVQQEEAGNALGISAGVCQCYTTSEAMANQEDLLQLQLLRHGCDVSRQSSDRVITISRRLGAAVASQLDGQGTPSWTQVSQLLRPLVSISSKGVHEDHRQKASAPGGAVIVDPQRSRWAGQKY